MVAALEGNAHGRIDAAAIDLRTLAAELRRYIAGADRKPDPCQRCGKLGGHGVDFSFDGIGMSSWICPHCLDAQEKRIAALETALRELSRRASDPDLYRRVGASWLMLDGAVKEADALLTKEPRKP